MGKDGSRSQQQVAAGDACPFEIGHPVLHCGCRLVLLPSAGSSPSRMTLPTSAKVESRQQKTRRPVQFELLEPARTSILAWPERRGGGLDEFAFPSRIDRSVPLSTRQYARLVDEWVRKQLWLRSNPPLGDAASLELACGTMIPTKRNSGSWPRGFSARNGLPQPLASQAPTSCPRVKAGSGALNCDVRFPPIADVLPLVIHFGHERKDSASASCQRSRIVPTWGRLPCLAKA